MKRNREDRDFKVQNLRSALSATTSPPWLRPGLCLRTVPDSLCHGGSVSRSPTYRGVLIPPPSPAATEQEGGAARAPAQVRCGGSRSPHPGAEKPAPPAKAEPLPVPLRTHPALPPASSPALDTTGVQAEYRSTEQLRQVGEGAKTTPNPEGPPPAVKLKSTRPAKDEVRLNTRRRDLLVLHPG